MKPFAKRFLAVTSAAAITFTTIPAVHAAPWKQQEDPAPIAAIMTADWSDLENTGIARKARSAAANAPVTRLDLSGMVMSSYRTVTGLSNADLGEPKQVFLDTQDLDVRYASELGLIASLGAGFFAPDQTVTRQEFFTAAVNLLDAMGYPHSGDITMDLEVFEDADQIREEARQAIQVLMCIGIIGQEGTLDPNGQITAEEGLALLNSVVDYYEQWQADPVHPQRHPGEDVAAFALNYVGCRYVSGCRGPNKFDCSGLVYYVYKNFGYTLNPSSQNQWSILGGTVKRGDLLPGDVLFFSRNGRSSGIFHVGIYIGDGQFVHAANSRKGVIVSGLDEEWYANRYLGAKRVID